MKDNIQKLVLLASLIFCHNDMILVSQKIVVPKSFSFRQVGANMLIIIALVVAAVKR